MSEVEVTVTVPEPSSSVPLGVWLIPCPKCHKLIEWDSLQCPYCGERLDCY